MTNRNRRFRRLCVKAATGDIDPKEKEALERWLAESREHTDELKNIEGVWARTALPETTGTSELPDVVEQWGSLRPQLGLERAENSLFPSIRVLFMPKLRPVMVGAFAVALLVTGIVLWNRGSHPPEWETVATTNREQRQIQLPDGSQVVLNHNSSIQFASAFDQRSREVRLTGEAFFSVVRDARPFTVTTINARTNVLGTQFDVWARGDETRVIVKEGRVNLSAANAATKGIDLTRGQSSKIRAGQQPSSPMDVDPGFMLGWMQGRLVFLQTPLNEIADELQRHFNVQVRLEGDSLKTRTLTGSFDNRAIDTVLTMICLTSGLAFEKHPEGYVIRPREAIP